MSRMRMNQSITLILALITCLAAPAAVALAESSRTVRLELSDLDQPFVVENLVGSMQVLPGSGDSVVAVATLHAESDELLESFGFEQVRNEKGVTTLRVIYPTDTHRTFRHTRGGDQSWLGRLFGGGSSNTSVKYGGVKVRVRSDSGPLLYADVEVHLPARHVEATFRNLVGGIESQDVEGKILYDVASGPVTLSNLRGEISADTASGDVEATAIQGSFSCDTGSGDCILTDFEGEHISCDVGSGEVVIRRAMSRSILADTGSGDVSLIDVDTESFHADTGSGDVEMEASGYRLAEIRADTGSGDVKLRLGPEATFEVWADLGGDIRGHYAEAETIRRNGKVGYRLGDARIRIEVDTGSGDLVITP